MITNRTPLDFEVEIPEQTVKVKKDNWSDIMLACYAEGRSDLAVCTKIGIQTKQFSAYYRDNDRFRELVDFGRQLSEAWWENQARENIANKGFNTPLFKAYMAKHFAGWTTKQETTVTNKTEYDVERLRQEVVDMLPDLMKLVPSAVPVKQLGHGSNHGQGSQS